MNLHDAIHQPWAISSPMFATVRDIYARHMRGEKADIGAIEARMGRPLVNEPQDYAVRSGIAVIPVEGVLAPKLNLMSQISGGTSTQYVEQQLARAVSDPNVKAVILAIDSPGGSVLGTPELAAAITSARQKKRVVAFSDGQIASAAYWIGSAAESVYLSGPTVMAGSIGVVAMHRDVSESNRAAGVKVTEISAGKYKRIAGQHEPLTTEGRASIQDQVDYLYSLFVDAVAKHRGVAQSLVLERMADGRVFVGQQAINAGLADGFKSLDQLVSELAASPAAVVAGPKTPASAPRSLGKEQLVAAATKYAATHKVDFVQAFKTLEANPALAASLASESTRELSKEDQVTAARRHAAEHGVTFVDAMKALGYAH